MSEQERYQKLANERQAAIDQSNRTYDDLLNKNTEYSQGVKNYLDNYQNTQNDIYDKQTAFQVDLQNQNKEKAEREYQKEAQASKNAYYDFINPYGAQAEIQAQNGLNNTGYAETTKLGAWNTQQNRLSNNQNLDSDYNNRYNTLYGQIQEEKARAEAIRQWEAEMAFKREQAALEQQRWEREYALSQAAAYSRGSSGGSSGGGKSGNTKSGSSNNSNTLSSNAQSIYNTIVNGIKTGKGLPFIGNSVGKQESTIKKAALTYFYNNGQLSDNDLRILASKLGV